MPKTEEQEQVFKGVWVPDFICGKMERGEITATAALIWSLITTCAGAKWESNLDEAVLGWAANKLGLSMDEVMGYIENMQEAGVLP